MPRPTFPPIADTVAFDLLYTSNDGVAIVDCMNRLWVGRDSGWSVPDMAAMATTIKNAWGTNIAPLVQTEYALHQINYKNWNATANATYEFAFTPVPGTAVGDPIPFTSCAIVRYLTDGVAPSSCYIRHGGIVESQVDGQHLATATVTAIAAGWQAVADAIGDIAHAQVCVQVFQPDPTPPNIFKDAGTREDITSVIVRRRLGRSVSRQK